MSKIRNDQKSYVKRSDIVRAKSVYSGPKSVVVSTDQEARFMSALIDDNFYMHFQTESAPKDEPKTGRSGKKS